MKAKIKRLNKSFTYARNGIWHTLLTQPNMWIHLFSALCTILLAWALGFNHLEWAVLLIVIILVLILEMINTVAEMLVDIASPEFSDLARMTKDVAAGSVLLAATGAILVGAILFIPKFISLLGF